MTTIAITMQNVNGDPATSGGNINITTGTTEGGLFDESGTVSLSSVESGDTLEIGGFVYTYEYLGSHLVRGDPNQPAAYIRIVEPIPTGAPLPSGSTFAIDLTGEPGDPDYPNLQNGNTKGSVADLDTTTPIQFPGYICFAKGTLIQTLEGEIAVEQLTPGDLINTADNGPQPVRWIGRRRLWADSSLAPIVISANVLSNSADLIVSPCHRVLLKGWRAELISGNDEVLVCAKHLLSLDGVYRQRPGWVEYFHVLLDQHEIIYANGQPAESLHLTGRSIGLIDIDGQDEVLRIFPELLTPDFETRCSARVILKKHEARILLA